MKISPKLQKLLTPDILCPECKATLLEVAIDYYVCSTGKCPLFFTISGTPYFPDQIDTSDQLICYFQTCSVDVSGYEIKFILENKKIHLSPKMWHYDGSFWNITRETTELEMPEDFVFTAENIRNYLNLWLTFL